MEEVILVIQVVALPYMFDLMFCFIVSLITRKRQLEICNGN